MGKKEGYATIMLFLKIKNNIKNLRNVYLCSKLKGAYTVVRKSY